MNAFSPAGHLPNAKWVREGVDLVVPLGEAALILVAAWLLRLLLRKALNRVCARYELPVEMTIGARRVMGTLIYVAATFLILQRLGVSASVLWTAITGFAAVAAVAFFAAWSVLSNIFCTFLILTSRPFRLHDEIELLENGEKPGLRGRVVDINLIYTTLQETRADGSDTTLQIPNSQFFQRSIRRWRGAS